jgi:DHA1 family bicyclomycin/chloramphenicol resistance-like MFS transporter
LPAMIAGNQLNVVMLRRASSKRIFSIALTIQVLTGMVFLVGTYLHWLTLLPTLILFFVFLSCIGLTYPNAAALALAPFSRNVGSASALLGFIQMGTGAVMYVGIAAFGAGAVVALLASTALVSLAVLKLGEHFIPQLVITSEEEIPVVTH